LFVSHANLHLKLFDGVEVFLIIEWPALAILMAHVAPSMTCNTCHQWQSNAQLQEFAIRTHKMPFSITGVSHLSNRYERPDLVGF
jgi:hypothetical protein